MAKGRRISGIWLPIQLDTSAVQADMERLGNQIASFANRAQKSFEGAINPKNLVKGIVDTTKALGMLRDSANALNTLNTKGFDSALIQSQKELRQLAEEFGGTTKQQQAMFQQMAQAQAINQEIAALQMLSRTLRLTKEETLAFVQARGRMVSSEAKSAFLPTKQLQDISGQLGQVAAKYRELARLSGTTANQEGFKQFLDAGRIRSAVAAFNQLHAGQKITARNYEQIARAAGVATAQVAKYVRESAKMQGRGWSGIFTPSTIAAGAQSAMGALGVVGGMYGAVELTKSAYSAALKMENVQIAFESVYNSASKASAQIEFVRKLTDELGISFVATADGAKRLFAASKGTELEKDANQIFKAFSTMGAALRLTGTEMDSVFLAVSQIISKGKVSAEELRLQLSERMPGAVNLFAKSIGVTVKELDKMLERGDVGLDALRKFAIEVERTYRVGAVNAAKGLQAELNRVSNAWFDLKRAFVDTESSAAAIRQLVEVMRTLANMAPAIATVAGAFLKFAAATSVVYGLIKAVTALQAGLVALRGVFAAGGILASLSAVASAPLAVAAAVGALGAAVWSMTSKQTAGEAAFEAYNSDVYNLGAYAEGASKKYADLNAEVAKTEGILAKKAADKAARAWADLTLPTIDLEDNDIGDDDIFADVSAAYAENASVIESKFRELQNKLSANSPESSKIIIEASKLGEKFISEFNSGWEKGFSGKETSDLISRYAKDFLIFQQRLRATGEDGGVFAEEFGKIVGVLLSSANVLSNTSEAIKDVGKSAEKVVVDVKGFNDAFDKIKRAASGTALAKALDFSKDANNTANTLVYLAKQADAAKTRLNDLAYQSSATGEEISRDKQFIQDLELALQLAGQAAAKNGGDFKVLEAAIYEAGIKAGLTADALDRLREAAKQGFVVAGADKVAGITSSLQVEQTMAGASALQKRLNSELSKLAATDAQKVALSSAIMANNVKGMAEALKEAGVAATDVNRIYQQVSDTVAATKTLNGNGSTIDKYADKIQDVRTQVQELRAAMNNSAPMSFEAKLASDLEELDKWMTRTRGGTKAQRAELLDLYNTWKALGQERITQLKAEEEAEKRKELTKANIRISSSFKKITGEDNSETVASAKEQYDRDLQFYQEMLAKKYISDEEYANKKAMLDAIMADQQLRSQTDMFSRLQVAINDYAKKYGDFTKGLGDVLTTAMDATAQAISAFAVSGARDFASLASAFESMAQRMLSAVANLLAQQAVSGLFSGIAGFFSSGASSATPGTTTSTNAAATAGNMNAFASSFKFSAKGGAFSGGNISGYSNSVVSSPTVFSYGSMPKFAFGAGLMGEAGPEAIMPLVRTNSGHLGVRAEGSGSSLQQSIVINVVDNAGVEKNVSESRDEQGNMNIEIMLEKTVGDAMRRPGSAPYRALQNTWGGAPALANR